ncbi:MAG: DUF427 domain-containing protein [Actinomycetota bacterium]|nr:DUF427 domain-containing protein [Actinomycetota bacterium]
MANSRTAAHGLATESVWDYPRPPAVVSCERRVRVIHAGRTVAESDRALRVLETASPPTIYVPPEDVRAELLEPIEGHTVCEWKGQASYFDVAHEDGRAQRAAWTYTEPKDAYPELRDHIAFYPGRVECYLDDERVRPQTGDFYGGWITDEIVGPHKGEPGTESW